ncbi:hypothetical protein J3F84DRAFT_373524 [Trichoderma pleuroticola]
MNDTMEEMCGGKASILFVLFILSFFSFSFVYDGIRGGSLADKPDKASALFHIYWCLSLLFFYILFFSFPANNVLLLHVWSITT